MNDLVRQGIAALKAGERNTARQRLISAVRQTPDDIDAWLWLSAAMERENERLDCLRQVLRIDPSHELARRGIQQILQHQASEKETPAPSSEEPPEELTSPVEETENNVQTEDATQTEDFAPEEDQTIFVDRLNAIISQVEPVRQASEPAPIPAVLTEPPASQPNTPQPVEAQPQSAQTFSRPRQPNPFKRGRQSQVRAGSGTRIFKIHPSLSAVLGMVWIALLGTWAMIANITVDNLIKIYLAIAVLGVMYLYLLVIGIRISTITYEMTTLYLSIPHRGKRALIPMDCILDVTTHQDLLQKMNGSGDILIEAIVDGKLARVGLRDVSKFLDYARQIDMLSSKARA